MSDVVAAFSATLTDLGAVRVILILLTVLGGAVVKGATGFGFPLVTAPILSTIWDPRHAVLLISLANLFNNIGVAARGGGSRQTLRRLLPTVAGLIVGVVIGALLLASLDAGTLGVVVGSAAVGFALVALLKPNLAVPPRWERYLGLPMGLAGGVLGGSTGISGPAIVSYLFALRLGKRELVHSLAVLYTVTAVVQVGSFVQLGLYDAPALVIGLLSCIPNTLGVGLGLRLQDRIDPLLFRRLVVVLIGLTGASLVLRGLWRG
jgi:uncharacterized membrane protein YfcA